METVPDAPRIRVNPLIAQKEGKRGGEEEGKKKSRRRRRRKSQQRAADGVDMASLPVRAGSWLRGSPGASGCCEQERLKRILMRRDAAAGGGEGTPLVQVRDGARHFHTIKNVATSSCSTVCVPRGMLGVIICGGEISQQGKCWAQFPM